MKDIIPSNELEIDNKQQPNADLPSYYVAVGASAGGLEAIDLLFANMPIETGLAFIVIQHLSPDYKSLMVELLSKRTQIQVHRAEDGVLVLPNNIYLIPPKKNLSIFHGKLILSEQDHSKGVNLPIDVFLKSLAEDQAEKSIGIILSGTGSDGTRGVRHIKEFGGMVMVQKEDTAKFDGMPRAAISTGLTDFILPPEEMPKQLVSFAKHPYVTKIERSETLLTDDEGLTKIFAILREKCKVDFTYYKPSTVTRRIERRMTINQTEQIKDYVNYLMVTPSEAISLYRELLIGVTSFFRDSEAFEALSRKWIPDILRSSQNREIRFWVAACSTGEEAYSLAMLIRECMEEMGKTYDIKIFATDIDRDAIHFAATGIYPESIAADLTPKLLAKYFYKKEDNFHIARSIREMVVFAQHNLIKDPPFTNISYVSCRNVLIYFQSILQHKVFEFFNFSLVPGGIMMLGTSETTGDMSDFFEPLDSKWKIFRSKGRFKPISDNNHLLVGTDSKNRELRNQISSARRTMRMTDDEHVLDRFVQTITNEYIPLTLIVNEQMEILHTLGDAQYILKLPAGKMVNDISKMAIKELSIPLVTGVQKVFRNRLEVRMTNIRINQNGVEKLIELKIKPLLQKKGQEMLVAIFVGERIQETVESNQLVQPYDLSKEAEEHLKELELDLQFTRENLQATIEELETSNEELQATNEELLASNEELQSTNEELQSTNEELFTVNAEYQSKIIELTELHNDINNILSTSQISQLLLDENLEVRRFSPQIINIFSLLSNDIGRPITHITHYLKDINPLNLIKEVQITTRPIEREVVSQNQHTYLMRVFPYAIGPKSFSGIVISFVDITELKIAENSLKRSESQFRMLFDTMDLGIVYHNAKGDPFYANITAIRILGLTLDQMQGKTNINPAWHTIYENGADFPLSNHPANMALKTGKPVKNVIMGIYNVTSKDYTWVNICATPDLSDNPLVPLQVFVTYEDISNRKNLEIELIKNEQIYRTLFDDTDNPIAVLDAVYDKSDKIIDFYFVKVNDSMQILLSPHTSIIVGKKYGEVFKSASKNWLSDFCNTLNTGHSIEFSENDGVIGAEYKVKVQKMNNKLLAVYFK